jgi:OmpR family response regulator RpaB
MTEGNGNQKILIVDDEIIVRQILQTRLEFIGYTVITATNGNEAIEQFFNEKPNLVVLDIMMPQLDGYSVCQAIRHDSDVPIIILTALEDVADRVTGLELGADDYIMKPFSPKELEARIRSVLRRYQKYQSVSSTISSTEVYIGSLKIDKKKRHVYKNNKKIKLTAMEFNLFTLLMSQEGKCLSRTKILKEVWDYVAENYNETRIVDVHISRLRSKLEDDPSNPTFILTSRGNGYFFQKNE